jgi:hypothetical protein
MRQVRWKTSRLLVMAALSDGTRNSVSGMVSAVLQCQMCCYRHHWIR